MICTGIDSLGIDSRRFDSFKLPMTGLGIDRLILFDPVPMLGIINCGCCWLLENCSSASTRHSSKSNSVNDSASENQYSVQTIATCVWVAGNSMLLLI